MNSNLPNICIVSDATDSITQSQQLADRLTSPDRIFKIYRDEEIGSAISSQARPRDLVFSTYPAPVINPKPYQDDRKMPLPDLAIGVGFNVTETMVNIKKQSGGSTKIAIILDPLAYYDEFDFIILPSYEPYKITGKNVVRTTGLINFVNTEYLNQQKLEFETHEKYQFLRRKNLKPPFLSVVIGGRHTGGNIDEADAKIIADKINEIISTTNGTALITTSKRTEVKISSILESHLKVPYFLYDYKKRESENPYGVFLALADEIIVTGESVRMMSECCSTNKPTRIYRPHKYGFQYEPLVNEFINRGYAIEFDGKVNDTIKLNKLDEATRIADIIRAKLP